MNPNDINDELIDRYLSHQMTEDEREAFEKELAQNPELKEEVALHKDIVAGIEMHFERDLKQKLATVEKEEFVRKVAPQRSLGSFRWVIGIAASFLLIMAGYYFFVQKAPTSTELYISYYQAYPNVISPAERSSGEVTTEAATALDLYEQEKYAAAIEAFEAQSDETLSTPALRFYYALSFLGIEDPSSAIPHLLHLSAIGNHNFVYQSQWYLGLAYLKANDVEKAKQVFNELKLADTSYSTKADEILKKLQ